MQKLWCESGDVVSHKASLQGHFWALNYNDVQYLLLLIAQNPDYFLDEWAGISDKKLKKIAYEWSKPLCTDFIGRMVKYKQEELGFLDEVCKDKRTLARGYQRLKMGCWAVKKAKFVQGRHTSTEALISLDGIVACKCVEGSMMKELFLEWPEFNVVSISEIL